MSMLEKKKRQLRFLLNISHFLIISTIHFLKIYILNSNSYIVNAIYRVHRHRKNSIRNIEITNNDTTLLGWLENLIFFQEYQFKIGYFLSIQCVIFFLSSYTFQIYWLIRINEIMFFIFTALLHPELIWDCTSHDNITLYTDQCSIIAFKNSIPEWKNKKEEIVAAWNHCLFHDTFRARRAGKVTISKSHVSMFHFENTFFITWMWKKHIPAAPVTAVNVPGRGAHIISNI